MSFVNEHAYASFPVKKKTQNSEQAGKKSVFCAFPQDVYYKRTIVLFIMHI